MRFFSILYVDLNYWWCFSFKVEIKIEENWENWLSNLKICKSGSNWDFVLFFMSIWMSGGVCVKKIEIDWKERGLIWNGVSLALKLRFLLFYMLIWMSRGISISKRLKKYWVLIVKS